MSSILTSDRILQHLKKQAELNKRNTLSAWVLVFVIGAVILYIGIQATPIWFSAILCLIGAGMILLFLLGLVGRRRMVKEYRDGKHLRFWITRNVCTGKNMRTISTESHTDDRYFFVLEGYGKFEWSIQSCIVDGIDNYYQYTQDLFDRTMTGDVFYLVFTEASCEKAELIIPASDWRLSHTDFVESEGRILPTA